MSRLTWDGVGQRRYETGVDHGVLYIPDATGKYANGVAWNGLTTLTESPSGAEASAQYADNMKYVNLISAEEFKATIEALTYPDEFMQFDGSVSLIPGLIAGQQNRPAFGLSYRTLIGDDVKGTTKGYKIHLVYGCTAAPSEKAYSTVNDSPEALAFSWELATTPVPVTTKINGKDVNATATIIIDSTHHTEAKMKEIEDVLYGSASTAPRLPLPDELITLLQGAAPTVVKPTKPAFANNTITIPSVTGVDYLVNGTVVPAGDLAITEDTLVTAQAQVGYKFPDVVDVDWLYEHS